MPQVAITGEYRMDLAELRLTGTSAVRTDRRPRNGPRRNGPRRSRTG
jgi:hypothetical protein